MFPTTELTKGASKEWRDFIVVATVVWLATNIIFKIHQHDLIKVQTKLANKQINELESKGL